MPEGNQQETASSNLMDRFRRLMRLTRKEMREILRDRRTIVTLILMPVLVYPLLSVAFQQFFLRSSFQESEIEYIIGFPDQETATHFEQFLLRYYSGQKNQEADSEQDFGWEPNSKETHPLSIHSYAIIADLEAAIMEGEIDVGITFRIDEGDGSYSTRKNLSAQCELIVDPQSVNSLEAEAFLRRLIDRANENFLAARLERLKVSQRAVPMDVEIVEVETEETVGRVSLKSIIPLILILMTITGAVYPAIDLTAGERERNTLEVLIAAPIPRLGLLIAKYLAVVSVAMLTATVNLFMMTVTLSATGLTQQLFGDTGVSLQIVLEVLGLLILFAMFFSAVMLALTSFARSFKEAQAYLIPLMLLSLTPGVLSLMPGLELSGMLAVVPLVNIVLLGRDILQTQAQLTSIVIVVISTSFYAVTAIAVAGKIFGAEGVLFRTHGSWSDMFRRSKRPANQATLTNAMLCLACIFPAYVITSGWVSLADQFRQEIRLFLSVILTASLFGLFPLIAAWFGHVRPVPGFSLHFPRKLALIGAALLGISLWPFAYELVLLTKSFQFSAEMEAQMEDIIARVRAINPILLILAYAVVPATFEELFFRGYLFNALRIRTTVLQTVVISAVIFGLFHFVTQGGLSFDRLINSTLLGLVLGWIRARSGSLWPGIVMHCCHNGFLLVLAHNAKEIEALFPEFQNQQHIPATWLTLAASLVLIGSCLIQFNKLKPSTMQPEAD